MMLQSYSVKCRFCDVLLVGREQFIGHMIHSHEMEHERLEAAWQSLSANLLNSNGSHADAWQGEPGSLSGPQRA
jgi:hypothetical protein